MEITKTASYNGEKFWNDFYRYPMKHLSWAWKNRIRNDFSEANLTLDGISDAHLAIIKSVIQNNEDAQMCIYKTFGSSDIDGTTLGIKNARY